MHAAGGAVLAQAKHKKERKQKVKGTSAVLRGIWAPHLPWPSCCCPRHRQMSKQLSHYEISWRKQNKNRHLVSRVYETIEFSILTKWQSATGGGDSKKKAKQNKRDRWKDRRERGELRRLDL